MSNRAPKGEKDGNKIDAPGRIPEGVFSYFPDAHDLRAMAQGHFRFPAFQRFEVGRYYVGLLEVVAAPNSRTPRNRGRIPSRPPVCRCAGSPSALWREWCTRGIPCPPDNRLRHNAVRRRARYTCRSSRSRGYGRPAAERIQRRVFRCLSWPGPHTPLMREAIISAVWVYSTFGYFSMAAPR